MIVTGRGVAAPVCLLVLCLAAVGCRSATPEWRHATSATGNYVAEFPGEPVTRTESAPDSPISTQFTFSESDEHSFGIVETTLNGIAAYPLDEAVDRSIEGSRADREEHTGGPVTVSEIWRTTGNFDGAETREFGYQLIDGDEKTTVNSVLFYRDGNVVQAMVVYDGEADQEAVDRFLSSLASEPS